MVAFYNEIEPFAAHWLEALMAGGEIADGRVERRSIADLSGADLSGYDRAHFFAGIGGWDYALQIAGWPAEWPVWTGSCPCQPFSAAGRGLGAADPRHLWPQFARLIGECRPPVVFGEQVASKAGRDWLAGVRADLEAMGYAVGAADLCAASVGAPHIRQRLYWVAYRHSAGQRASIGAVRNERDDARRCGETCGGMADSEGTGSPRRRRGRIQPVTGAGVGMVNANSAGPQGRRMQSGNEHRERAAWSSGAHVECADGKARRVEPGVCPLAHGVPGRVGQLRGYGNAIVPQVAAQFVSAFVEEL